MQKTKLDPYLQDDCNVLKNKLGIKDSDVLNTAEYKISTNKIRKLSKQPLKGDFDFKHLCNLHKYVFGDIYEWAGEPRTVPIAKSEKVFDGDTVQYAQPRYIPKEIESACDRMNQENWTKMPLKKQSIKLAEYMSEIWKIHPFREGNTRTTVNFMCDFAESHGMPIERQLFADNAKYTRDALVISADNPQCRKFEYIQKMTKDALERGLTKQKGVSSKNIFNFTAKPNKTSNVKQTTTVTPFAQQNTNPPNRYTQLSSINDIMNKTIYKQNPSTTDEPDFD
jgi:cell filamentation protein